MDLLRQFARLLTRGARPADEDAGRSAEYLLASLLTMAWFVEARDPYTGGHLWRVSRYSRLLAEHLGFSEADSARAGLGGFLHDLGKVGVPDAVLRKASRLSAEEYAVIKTHPDIGLRMLAGHPLAALVRDAVYLHHERPDGLGYPRGLRGDAIPVVARIVGVADAFDAMTSYRSYRAGMPRDTALGILESEQGTQFDARLCGTFVAIGRAGLLDDVIGHSEENIPLQTCPMCGPTVVIRADHAPGESVFCRNCASGFEVTAVDGRLAAMPTGRVGTPSDLEPDSNAALIRHTVARTLAALPVADLVRDATRHGEDEPSRPATIAAA